jgi:TonB family protein
MPKEVRLSNRGAKPEFDSLTDRKAVLYCSLGLHVREGKEAVLISGRNKATSLHRFLPGLGALLIFISLIRLPGTGCVLQAGNPTQSEYQKTFQAGKALYENGDHKEAIIKLLQALFLTKDNAEIAEANMYLALTYYALGEKDNIQLYLKKLFEAQPDKDIEAGYFPVSFVGLFYIAKNDAARSKKQTAETVKPLSRGDLVPLNEADVQPRVVKSFDPVYPPAAWQVKAEREVIVEALISEDGDVLQVRPPEAPVKPERFAKEFQEAAKKALLKWKFTPARKGGIAVRVWKPVTFVFKINPQ